MSFLICSVLPVYLPEDHILFIIALSTKELIFLIDDSLIKAVSAALRHDGNPLNLQGMTAE